MTKKQRTQATSSPVSQGAPKAKPKADKAKLAKPKGRSGEGKAPKAASESAAKVAELELVPDDEGTAGDLNGELEDDLETDLEDDLEDDLVTELGEDEAPSNGGNGRSLPSRKPPSLPRPYRSDRSAVGYQDPLQLYLREISSFPLLKPEEEKEFARRVRDSGDSEAAFRLVSSHLRLVVKIAMDFQRRWMQNVLDLIQEGNVGLMRAVQKFDPEKGIKFSYYAAFWIKAYILKFIMDNWRLVKIGTTQAQRKLFYNLNKERQRLRTMGFDADTATISRNLGVTEEQVREMEQRLDGSDMSLDVNVGEDSTATRLDFLPALGPGIEQTLADDEIARTVREQLATIVPTLSDKEVDILHERLLSDSPTTLREIGEKYGITRERVRQLETRLLKKLRTHLSNGITDFSREWIVRDD